MKINDIIGALKGKVINVEPREISGVSIDTRTIKSGNIFFALQGPHFDGHNFVKEAFKKGASFSVVEHCVTGKNEIIVSDPLYALGQLARYHRQSIKGKIIGITGSVGKTTTKEFLASILSRNHSSIKSEKNYNNLIGVPLSLLKVKDEEFVVIEMGSNKKGEIDRLSYIVEPDIGIITEISAVHTEFFGDIRGVFEEKKSMLKYLRGELIVNGDNSFLKALKYKDKTTIGFRKNNDFIVSIVGMDEGESIFSINGEVYKISIPGKGSIVSAAIAAVTAIKLGIGNEDIRIGLYETKGPPHRMEMVTIDGVQFIDDTYNASPLAMKNAIDFLAGRTGRKLAILGDMLELGDEANDFHREIGKYLRGKVDQIFVVGEKAKFYIEGFGGGIMYKDISEIISAIVDDFKYWEWVLVKGSRKLELDRIISTIWEKECSTTSIT